MRYSPFAALEQKPIISSSDSNERFFAAVEREMDAAALCGAILLVGAKDPRALALRRAQAVLRFDRRPSRWSHAALIVRWREPLSAVSGVEVALNPLNHREQVPERNGVTPFTLSRYFDEQVYPNVALIVLGFGKASAEAASTSLPQPAERRRAAMEAALTPIRQRERFPLWDMLGAWARFSYLPYSTPNPLLEGIPFPSAALCEYAYEAAGLDLTPGATGNNNCPEVLYATAKHWGQGLGETQSATVRLFSIVREEHEIPQSELPARIEEVKPPSREELEGKRPKD